MVQLALLNESSRLILLDSISDERNRRWGEVDVPLAEGYRALSRASRRRAWWVIATGNRVRYSA